MDISDRIDHYLTEAQPTNLDAVIMTMITAVSRFKGSSKDSPARFQALSSVESLLVAALLSSDPHQKQNILSRSKTLYGFAKTLK